MRGLTSRRVIAVAGVMATMCVFSTASTSPALADDCPNAEYRVDASAGLPDCRALEMVTPVEKPNGRGVSTPGGVGQTVTPAQPSADGDRMILPLGAGILTPDTGFGYTNEYGLAERTSDGWATKPLTPGKNFAQVTVPPTVFAPVSSDDFGTMNVTTNGAAFLVPDMVDWPNGLANPLNGDTPAAYVRTWGEGAFTRIGPGEPSQGVTGSLPSNVATLRPQPSPDGTHTLLTAAIRGMLGSTDPSLDQLAAGTGGATLYDTAAGQTRLVGTCTGSGTDRTRVPSSTSSTPALQDPQPCAEPAAGRSARLISTRGAVLGGGSLNAAATTYGGFGGAISVDGGRVFFESPDPTATSSPTACSGSAAGTSCPPALYVRQLGADGEATTRWISRSQVPNQVASLMGRVVFEGASRDGSKVFFRTNAPLTADDPNGTGAAPPVGGVTTGTPSANSWDLYEYDLSTGGDPGNGMLTRITAGPNTSDPNTCAPSCTGATILGQGASLRYVSADGNRLYFVTNSPLAGVSSRSGTTTVAGGTPAVPGSFANLYAYDATKTGAARWEFIARLPRTNSGLDSCATFGGLRGQPRQPTGASAGSNCVRGTADGRTITFQTGGALVAADADAAQDVYRYDAEKSSSALAVVSQPPAGAGGPAAYACAPVLCNGDLGYSSLSPDTAQRNMSEDGTVYFESRRRLTGDDTNDVYDVYAAHRDGTLALMSPRGSTEDAYYSGNSRDGRDVFILTYQPLSAADVDREFDVYDARVGGGFPAAPEEHRCDPMAADGTANACQPAPSPVPFVPEGVTDDDVGSPGNAVVPDATFSLTKISSAQQRSFASTGRLTLSVKPSEAGVVTARATSLVAKRNQTVASATRSVAGGGAVTLALRLSSAARKQLARAKKLTVKITVAYSKVAVTQGATLRLKQIAKSSKAKTKSKTKSSKPSTARKHG